MRESLRIIGRGMYTVALLRAETVIRAISFHKDDFTGIQPFTGIPNENRVSFVR